MQQYLKDFPVDSSRQVHARLRWLIIAMAVWTTVKRLSMYTNSKSDSTTRHKPCIESRYYIIRSYLADLILIRPHAS